ncbi:hypothetical protein NRB16_25560 [Pseudomonas sp. LJDD11]|uniref:PilW family protein n=1 Tax=Pseudomonas sp. LJDD11 TaxID=2931984 RepID=UPI00211C0E93|nr:hypothetical protein [Pseudomonas sp. LJDD11]MCQ9426884.1 hypothetical protein [Pseudomonas sp. LJDD11]
MKRPQRGFNLISLMIGMTLSLISILAMLALYKNMVGISVRSIQDAQQDGQVSAGFLTAQLEMRNAGFGIVPSDTTPTDVASKSMRLLQNARLTSGTLTGDPYTPPVEISGNALIWVSKMSTTADATCAGLLVQSGQLVYLKAASTCRAITDWGTTTWTQTILVAAPKNPADDTSYGNIQSASFFKTEQGRCWPFGKYSETQFPNSLKVIMTASISAKDSTGNAIKSVSEICLPNIPIPLTTP